MLSSHFGFFKKSFQDPLGITDLDYCFQSRMRITPRAYRTIPQEGEENIWMDLGLFCLVLGSRL